MLDFSQLVTNKVIDQGWPSWGIDSDMTCFFLFFFISKVNDFLSGRSPLTLALRVGDHMMFVQLQLAAQQAGGSHLQHRHLITRGTEHNAAPHFRTLHTSATPVLSRLAGCTQGSSPPSESAPASSTHCDASRSSSLTTSVFRSHGEGVAVSPCAEVSTRQRQHCR